MESRIDLRSTPTWERHGLVCAAFSDLRDDETLHLIYDYEPRPLRRRFEDTFSHRFVWTQRGLSRERWEISVRKLAVPSDFRSTTQFMRRCPIFSGASESTRKMLAPLAESRTVRRKTTIAEQESEWPFLGIVKTGRVFAIVGSPSGREQILFEALETEVFGNAAVLRLYAPTESGLAAVDAANLPSLRLTQIATATGTVKEVVARAVAELERAGAIRRVRGRIAYMDREMLGSFAF